MSNQTFCSTAHRYSKRSDSASSATNRSPTETALPSKEEESPNIIVYKKMESFLERMQDPHTGVVVRTVKSFMSKIPSVFTGTDLITWMMRTLDVEDTIEALHLANLMCAHGYIFPIDDHILTVKNDGAYYRFQTPCFWPTQVTEPESTDYAVYLCKRTMQNKQRLELADYEAENLARLQKTFSRKWEFIFLQAEAQAKVDKKRDKLERKVLDSQERAFWDVHRPAPGCVNTTEVDIKKACRSTKTSKLNGKVGCVLLGQLRQSSSVEADLGRASLNLKAEIEKLRNLIERRRIKISKVAESYMSYFEQYSEFDPFITPPEPSNPWISDNVDFWEQESTTKDIPQRRVKRWGFSVRELLKDPAGREHFRRFLEKEFSAENLKFWEACQRLRCISQAEVQNTVQDIYTEYLADEARDSINVDCKVSEAASRKVAQQPDRYCFVEAEEHIYQLMKNDSYSRYLRSEMYKEFLSGTKKKVLSVVLPFRSQPARSIIPKLPSLSMGGNQ